MKSQSKFKAGDLIVFNKTGEWCLIIGEKIPICGPLLNGDIVWSMQWGSTTDLKAHRSLLAADTGDVNDWNLNYFLGDAVNRDGTIVHVG